jgi:hypothetical protein
MKVKMKIYIAASVLIIATATNSYAGCVGMYSGGNCLGTYVDNPHVGKQSGDQQRGYTGSSGSEYEYDLSTPSGSIGYQTDLDAQRRDTQSLSVGRDRDLGLGQIGGGIYD